MTTAQRLDDLFKDKDKLEKDIEELNRQLFFLGVEIGMLREREVNEERARKS